VIKACYKAMRAIWRGVKNRVLFISRVYVTC
jgi:hypothetical protein